jgi:hypothetical protein
MQNPQCTPRSLRVYGSQTVYIPSPPEQSRSRELEHTRLICPIGPITPISLISRFPRIRSRRSNEAVSKPVAADVSSAQIFRNPLPCSRRGNEADFQTCSSGEPAPLGPWTSAGHFRSNISLFPKFVADEVTRRIPVRCPACGMNKIAAEETRRSQPSDLTLG